MDRWPQPIALLSVFSEKSQFKLQYSIQDIFSGKDHETQPHGDAHNYLKLVVKRKTTMQFCFHVRLCDIQAPALLS